MLRTETLTNKLEMGVPDFEHVKALSRASHPDNGLNWFRLPCELVPVAIIVVAICVRLLNS